MKKTRKFSRLLAVVLAMVLCLSMSGCGDMSQMMEMMEMMQGPQIEILEEGADIYSLSLFDELPNDFSKADPLFWVAEGENGGKVYLLGSIHVADEQAYRIPEHIMNAYLESDALAVECDILAAQSDLAGQLSMMSYYMYTDGSKISDHIDPELYEAMVDFYNNNPSQQLTQMGYNLQTLQTCKPSMWQSVFETIMIEKANLDSEMGIDQHFLTLAKSQQKQVIEIESVEFQASMLSSFPDELNELLLSEYVYNDADEYAAYYYESYQKWLEGDAEFFYTETETDYSQTGMSAEEIEEYESLINDYNTAMLDDRNVGMADAAEKMLERGDNVFYVVGAAHMGGATGVVTLLRERGWTVNQLGGKNADAFTTPGKELPSQTVVAEPMEGNDSDDNSNIDLGVTPPQSSTAGDFNLSGNLDDYYDQYVELFEHFGGTTRPAEKEEEKETTRTTRPTSSDNSAWHDWGSN